MISLVERATIISVFGEPKELTALVDEFKFKHPDRYRIQSYQLYSRTKHSDNGPTGWDGYIKPLKRTGLNQAEIRRGFKDDLLANIKKFKMELNEDSKLLVSPFNKLTTADIPDNIIDAPFALDENQRLCIVNWLKHGMGLGKISVNGGKTACFAGFAAMLKTFKEDARMLYVTDRERLTAQVDREMQNFLPGWDITKYGGGKSDKTGKDMVVCTLAMIRKHLEELIEEGWINSFNAVLFDECVSGDALITLSDGSTVTAQNIASSRCVVEVLTFNEKTGIIEPRPAVAFGNGIRRTLTITLKSGAKIRCTANHPVFSKRGWVHAENLTLTDFIAISNDKPTKTTGIRKSVGGCLNANCRAVHTPEIVYTPRCEAGGASGSEVPDTQKYGGNASKNSKKRRLGWTAKMFQHFKQFRIFRDLSNLLSIQKKNRYETMAGEYNRGRTGLVVHGRWQPSGSRSKHLHGKFFKIGKCYYSELDDGQIWSNSGCYTREKEFMVSTIHKSPRGSSMPINRTPHYSRNALQAVCHYAEKLQTLRDIVCAGSRSTGALFSTLFEHKDKKLPRQLLQVKPPAYSTETTENTIEQPSPQKLCGVPTAILNAEEETGSVWQRKLPTRSSQTIQFDQIVSIEADGTYEEVFDLTVEHNHNYFANGILVHNCHHAASESAEKLMMEIKGAFFRIGASDTAKEKNIIAWHTIKGLLGPVRVTVDSAELIEMGRSAVPHIYMIDPPGWEGKFEHVPYNASRDSTAWVLFEGSQNMVKGTYQGPVLARDPETGQILTEKKRELKGVKFVKTEVAKTVPGLHQVLVDGVEYEVNSSYCLLRRSVDECIIRFKERNELIAEWVRHFSNQNKRTLVVATRTIHVLILESVISEAVDPDLVRILVGEDSAKKRDETFEWFKSTPGAVLISPLVKEGVSINEIEAGVVADYVGDFEYAKQIIGRFMRKKKDGENVCEIAWFWDRQQTRFERGCKNLFKELRQQKGFVYYHPVVHPADAQRLKQDDLFVDTTAEIESAEGVNVDTSARTA